MISRRHPEVAAAGGPRRATAGADHPPISDDRQRIDKWLWHARMVRTRSAAAALVAAGHVRLNGQRVLAASQPVRAGDVVTLALDRSVRVVRAEGFAERRGGAADARALYRELTTGSGLEASTFPADTPKVSPPPRD